MDYKDAESIKNITSLRRTRVIEEMNNERQASSSDSEVAADLDSETQEECAEKYFETTFCLSKFMVFRRKQTLIRF